jgi:hypothetical protein
MSEKMFYHFLSSKNAIHDLERKMIKVSLLDALNDPFELSPWLPKDKKERARFSAVREAISKKDGLLCFSGFWSEPLLWGHYADKHKGIAIGFEISNYKILKVVYAPERVKVDLTGDSQRDEILFRDTLANVKYEKWEYENEFRVWVELINCNKIDGHYFIKFGESLKVKEIVLGCNYDNSVPYILELSENLGAVVIPSRMAWSEYKVNPDRNKIKKFQQIKASSGGKEL